MMHLRLKLLVSEKSADALNQNKYTFQIGSDINKIMLKQYLENKFKINIISINTLNNRGKIRRRGMILGKTKDFKKAIVTVKAGQEIKEFKEAF